MRPAEKTAPAAVSPPAESGLEAAAIQPSVASAVPGGHDAHASARVATASGAPPTSDVPPRHLAPVQAAAPALAQPPIQVEEPALVAAPRMPVSKESLGPAGATPVVSAEPMMTGQKSSQPISSAPTSAAFLVRCDSDVGVAGFRRGDVGLVVFDRRIATPAAPGESAWEPGPVTMTLKVPLAPDEHLQLTRVPAGWSVLRSAEQSTGALQSSSTADGLALKMPRAGRVVTILDPLTGGALLVGTSLTGGGEGAVADLRRSPDYALLPTWLGVAVEPSSDRVDLRAAQGGFMLVGGAKPGPVVAATGSRRFDFPDQPAPMLLNRLHAQLAGAAAAPPRARTPERVAAAQSMLSLGMATEAQALMQLVLAEDPQAAMDAQALALSAMAATLGGRPAEGDALDDKRLTGTDEIALWRGLRDRRMGSDTEAARNLGDRFELARSYPAPLRDLVLPEVAEAAAEAGRTLPPDQAPRFAQAIQLERGGKVDEALAIYDGLTAGRDRLDQVRATVRATELRLAAGRIDAPSAAAVYERQSFVWRGDGREAAFRMRAAELRGTAGEWRAALDALRTIDGQFPDQHKAVQLRKANVLQAMLAAQGGGLSPLDLVLLAAEFADGVPEDTQGGALARLLADKLLALDLPARAIPILQGLMKAAPAGEPRAEFGSRLAQLLLDGGDPAGAVTALNASASLEVSGVLKESRALVMARARAAQGDVAGAVAGLFEVGTAATDDVRASLLADAGDWRGSLAALSDLAAKQVPSGGVLPDAAQEVLLRQASAAARIPDLAALSVLERSAPRLTGSRADLFRVLVAPPIAVAAELPRAAQELRLARAIPQQLMSVGPR